LYTTAAGYGYSIDEIDAMTLGDLIWVCEGIAKRQEREWQMSGFVAYMIAAVNTDKKSKLPPFTTWWGINEPDETSAEDKRKLIDEAIKRGEEYLKKMKL
jgi:hypothetical protein